MATAVADLRNILTRYRELALAMAWQEIRDRHAGQMFGFFWSIFYPLVFLGVYVFIFAFVFQSRAGIGLDSDQRVLYLLSGLIPWLAAMETLGRSPLAISGNASLVKQVVFPIEILPLKTVVATLFNQGIFLVLLFVVFGVLGGPVNWGTFALLPVALLLQTVGLLGVSYFLASVTVYVPDLKEVIRVFSFLGVFATPILLPVDQVPRLWGALYYANPFSYMVWAFQDTLAGGGSITRAWIWWLYAGLSIISFFAGYSVFRRLRHMFGNVL